MKRFRYALRLFAMIFLISATAIASSGAKVRPERIMRSAWDPIGNIYGVVPNYEGISSLNDPYYGRLDIEQGRMHKIWNGSVFSNSEEAYVQSGFVRNDILYIPQLSYGDTGMVTGIVEYIWKRVDLNTGKTLPALNFGSGKESALMFTYGLTYDPIHDVVYGLAYDNETGLGGILIKVDCSLPEKDWKAEELFNAGGSVSNWMAGICYDPLNETLYGLNNLGNFCELDLENKAVVSLREYDDFDDFCFPAVMNSYPMVYSPKDKAIIYVFADNNTGVFEVCAIDLESGDYDAVYLSTLVPRMQVASLYCSDPFARDEAPGQIEKYSLDFTGNNLTGSYSFTAPVNYFNDVQLDKNITMHILVNSEEFLTKEVAPGETVSGQMTLTQGYNTITAYCSVDGNNGPELKLRRYIGNDQPYAPTNLSYKNGVLTWKAPVNKGVNNGYIDLSGVTYNVYINGEKINDAPISGTSYAFTVDTPADGRKEITVTATANGVESEKSAAISRVLGTGYNLPLTIAPTQEESTLFETLNANNDAYQWSYVAPRGSEPSYFEVHMVDYKNNPDDWLFLPPMNFDSAVHVYNLMIDYVNARRSNIQKDNLDIFIGTDPLPESMNKLLYSHTARIQDTWTLLDISFSVDKPGTYFIGIHSKPGDDTFYRGIALSNFRIKKTEATTQVPGELTDVTLTPAELGELFVTVNGTFPTKDMAGNPLPQDQDVSLLITSEINEELITGKPGGKFEETLGILSDGFTDVFITPSNSYGKGSKQVFTAYVGFDNPVPPTNIRYNISADNRTLHVEWDPVGEVGAHGGYVDVNEVVYDFYTQSTASATKLGSAGKKCFYDYSVPKGIQARYYVGPVATNFMGISTNGFFITETLGNLYDTPMKEEWGMSAFNLYKWLYNTVAPYNNVKWNHMTDADSDTPSITFGQGGAMRADNMDTPGKAWGELMAPRLSTINDTRVGIKLRYYNFAKAGHMELWGKTYSNQEFVKIAELDPTRQGSRWEDWEVRLPDEFCGQEWIQVNVRAYISPAETVIIDSYEIAQLIDDDFQLTSISSPYSVFVGEEPEFDIVVTNNGTEMGYGTLDIELVGNDMVLASQHVDIERIRSKEKFEYVAKFPILEDYINYDYIELRARTEADGDSNPRNNEKVVDILLYDNSLPIVRDLSAERDTQSNDVKLSWSEPDSSEKGLESMEVYSPFIRTEKIGPWTNVDIDGRAPFVISSMRWSGDDMPGSWTIFDAEEMGSMKEERLSPRSGKQMLIARSVAYDSSYEAPTRSMDFLISPEIKGGSKVSFWLNTLDSQYAETVAIFYSTTDMTLNPDDVDLNDKDTAPRQCGSFKWLKNFTKTGAETWEQCEFTLPEDAKYFAFVYSSFGMFGAMIDDIVYEPVEPAKMNIEGYDVLVSYNNETPVIVKRDLLAPGFTHSSNEGRKATYYVVTNVADEDKVFTSPLSNPAMVAESGVDGLEYGQFITGTKGAIIIGGAAGQQVTICDVAGRVINSAVISYDRQQFALDPAIYLVTLGKKTVKVIVR